MPHKIGEKAVSGKGMRLVRSWETLLILIDSSDPLTAEVINKRIHADGTNLGGEGVKCSVQTTREDLKTLQECGFPVCMVDKKGQELINIYEKDSAQGVLKNVGWRIRDPRKLNTKDPSHQLPIPTTSDLVTLSLCRALLNDVAPSQYPLYRYLSKMLEELQVQINKALRFGDPKIVDMHGKIQILGRKFVGESVSLAAWPMVTTAIARRQVLLATYENREGEKRNVDIAPLAVWFSEGRAYVLAAGATDRKVRAWRIDRFSDISVALGRKAPEVSDEVIEDTLRNSFKGYISDSATICLKVKPEAAYLFREFQYHPSQQIVELADGSLDVTIECTLGWGLEEWILGLGELIAVKGPEVLRDKIKSRLEAGLSEYR